MLNNNTERFDKWQAILDRYESGELTAEQASKQLDELRMAERQKFEEVCQNRIKL